MQKPSRFIALVLGVALVAPGYARADQTTLQQQVNALQHQMQELQQENTRARARIDKLEQRLARQKKKAKAAVWTASASYDRSSDLAKTHIPIANYAAYRTAVVPAAREYGTSSSTSTASMVAPANGAGIQTVPGTLGSPAPTDAATTAVYQQENAVFNKGITLTPAFEYSYGDTRFFTLNGFMALGAIFLGNIDTSRQQNSIVSPSLNIAYGASKRLEFDMTLPFVYRQSTYSSQGAQTSSAQTSETTLKSGAIGDINTGLYYQLRQKTASDPVTILSAHVNIPTGISPWGIKVYQDPNNQNLSLTDGLPTGQGVFGVQIGASMIKTIDPAVLFGGISYNYNLIGHFADISPYENQRLPGAVQPGGALSLNVGTAFSLNDKMSTSFSFTDSIVDSTRTKVDGQRWQTVVGSSLNAAVFNIGMTYAVNRSLSYQTVLGIGVTRDAPNFTFTLRVPHYL